MHRPLMMLTLFFTAGIAMAPVPQYAAGMIVCMLLLLCLGSPHFLGNARTLQVRRRQLLRRAAFIRQPIFLLAFAAGLFYAASYEWGHRPALEAYVGKDVVMHGKVTGEPVWKNGSWRFRLDTSGGESAVVKIKQSRAQAIRYGDLLEVSAVLEKPSPARNPGAFHAQAYYQRQGIQYALTAKTHRFLGRDDRGLKGRVFVPIRQKLLQVIREQFPGEHSAVVAGLVLGITSEIDEETMESFRVMGVVHVLAVSGANVAMILLPFLALLKRLKVAERRRYLFGIILVLLYGGVTGGGPSVVRACTMAVVWCTARIVSRETDLPTSWALAGLIALLMNPQTLYDPGFQLTMLLTMGLLLLPDRLRFLFKKLPDKLATLLAITLTAELLSIPLVLTLHPAFTPLSLLANLLIIPLLTLLIPLSVCTILLGVIHPLAAFLPACAARLLLDVLIQPLHVTGQARWLVRNYQAPETWWLFGYYAWWWLYANLHGNWRKRGLTVLACSLLLTLLLRDQPLRVTFLDVGQGDSALIQTSEGQVWLIDTGGIPGFLNSDYDVGQRVVVPALAAYGIDQIDVLLLTHADEDHIRGAQAVLDAFPIGQVLVPDIDDPSPFFQDLIQKIRHKQIPIQEPRAGHIVRLEKDLTIRFWNPTAVSHRNDTNANSLVFSLHAEHHTFLFTGDAEQFTTTLRHVDVLKVPHHGSQNDTPPTFTFYHAILSVGAKNRYGHPAPSTLRQLEHENAAIWRTDRQGAVEVTSDGKTLRIKTWLPAHDTGQGGDV